MPYDALCNSNLTPSIILNCIRANLLLNVFSQRKKNATITYYIYLYINIHNVVAYWFVSVAAPLVYIQDNSPVIK